MGDNGTLTWRDRLQTNRLENIFKDFKPALDDHEAEAESNRCIHCFDAPCIRACPTGIDIPQFIGRIADANRMGAARTILNSNILGLSCAVSCPTEVLCEGACVYNNMHEKPIMIGKLQRYAVEEAYRKNVHFFKPGKKTGKKVALVGAGPASLACAHELRKYGHDTVVFEKTSLPGGLNTYGIAPYKMKAQMSLLEIEQVTKIGVEIRFNQELGRDIKLPSLLKEYDAVFLGLGLGPDSRFDAPGGDAMKRVYGAVEFISALKTSPSTELAWVQDLKSALVIGGGNTALDACRELKKMGLPKVVVSYRRGEAEMSGYAHELRCARQEGVEFWFNTLPVSFEPTNSDQDDGFRAAIAKTVTDSQGHVEATTEVMPLEVGLVLVATGQSKLEKLLSDTPNLKFKNGRLMIDSGGRTDHVKIFAGGDLANGGKEVVNAVAEGKTAAKTIHEVLTSG